MKKKSGKQRQKSRLHKAQERRRILAARRTAKKVTLDRDFLLLEHLDRELAVCGWTSTTDAADLTTLPPLEILGEGFSALQRLFGDHGAMYGLSPDERLRYPRLPQCAAFAQQILQHSTNEDTEAARTILIAYTGGARFWIEHGAVTLRAPPELAAAFMVTDSPWPLAFPWPALRLSVPDKLLPMSGDHARYILVVQPEADQDPGSKIACWAIDSVGVPCPVTNESRALLASEALTRLICNYVASAVECVTGHHIEADVTAGPRRRWRPACSEPETSDYVLRPPVTVRSDLSGVVRSLALGESPFGKFQWLVRGHWRNQVCGPARSERRATWIAPYWKGPVDAPMFRRDYHVLEEPE
jgi:hypothetical protein